MMTFPIYYGKIKHVPNHQPVMNVYDVYVLPSWWHSTSVLPSSQSAPEAPHRGHSHFSHRPQAQAECPQDIPTHESGLDLSKHFWDPPKIWSPLLVPGVTPPKKNKHMKWWLKTQDSWSKCLSSLKIAMVPLAGFWWLIQPAWCETRFFPHLRPPALVSTWPSHPGSHWPQHKRLHQRGPRWMTPAVKIPSGNLT